MYTFDRTDLQSCAGDELTREDEGREGAAERWQVATSGQVKER